MKIHYFYLVKKHISKSEFPAIIDDMIIDTYSNECTLYAYTPEKSSAEYFKKTRNMKIFYEKIVHMSREDYEEFADKHVEFCLEEYRFNTKRIRNGTIQAYQLCLLCTNYEHIHIMYFKSDIIRDMILKITPNKFDLINFNESINNSLNTLLYRELMDEVLHPIDSDIELNYDVFNIDEFLLYIRLFSNTFKSGDKH